MMHGKKNPSNYQLSDRCNCAIYWNPYWTKNNCL